MDKYSTIKLKKIPEFKNEEEEFEFWSTHDFTEYLNYKKSKIAIFSNLKPSKDYIKNI